MSSPDCADICPPIRLNALTSLRFFAAAFIMLGHFQGSLGIPVNFIAPFNHSLAVSFFFVLSGFILAWVYPALDRSDIKSFLIARFARIWPMHIAAFILIIVLLKPRNLLLSNSTTWWMTFANLSLTHAWIPYRACGYRYNSVSWSVSTEAFFYACFPLLIYKWRQTWWWKLLLAAGVVVAMITFCNVTPIPDGIEPLQNGVSVHVLLYNHPAARLFEFVLGMTMALLFRWLRTLGRLRLPSGTLLELVTVGFVVLLMYYSANIQVAAQRVFPCIGEPGSLWLGAAGICSPAFGFLILVMALNQGIVSRWLAHPCFVFLGEISYSVYLLHPMTVIYFVHHRDALTRIPNPVQLLMCLSIVLMASYLTWKYVEVPCREWMRNFGKVNRSVQKPSLWSSINFLQAGLEGAVFVILIMPVIWNVYGAGSH